MAAADIQLLDELGELIEDLTTTGAVSLNEKILKKVKSICKTSDLYVRHVYHLVMTQLKKDHSEIRLSAFQIIDQLFMRSHVFRELLLEEFQVFLELTVESDFSVRLPPPKSAAEILKQKALEAIEKWNQKFGSHYKKLALGYTYLKRVKHIEFDTVRSRSVAERRRSEERETRRRNHLQQKLALVDNQISEMEGEIKLCLTEMENCFKLLLPHPDEYEVHDTTGAGDVDSEMTAAIATSRHATELANNDTTGVEDIDSEITSGQTELTDETATSGHAVNLAKENSRVKSNDEVGHPSNEDSNNHSDNQRASCVTPESQHDRKNSCDDETKERNGEVTVSGDDEGSSDHHSSAVIASHGLGSRSYRLSIDLNLKGPVIHETSDNSVIITTLREMNKEVTQKLLPMAVKWLSVLSKGENTQQRIRQVIDLKQAMEAARDKFTEINLVPMEKQGDKMLKVTKDSPEVAAEEGSDDEFEDVPEKEGLELEIPAELRQEYGLEPLTGTMTSSRLDVEEPTKGKVTARTPQESQQDFGFIDDTINDPAASTTDMLKYRNVFRTNQKLSTTATCTSTSSTSCPEDSEKRKKLLEQAPVVPFDVDLLFWNDPTGGAPSVIKHDSIHRFYGSKDNADEEFVPDAVKGQVRKRFMTFAGKFEPVKWSCRAPLPSGKLCPRRDRLKCPFHGKIIPRDESGKPAAQQESDVPDEAPDPASGAIAANEPNWREIQPEIEAATGLNLGGRRKRKVKTTSSTTEEQKLSKKAKYARLTNLKKSTNTPRTRLEKKVLSERAVRRVTEQMGSITRKINKDRFSHQYNYAMQN